jgi:hypothetical protein
MDRTGVNTMMKALRYGRTLRTTKKSLSGRATHYLKQCADREDHLAAELFGILLCRAHEIEDEELERNSPFYVEPD